MTKTSSPPPYRLSRPDIVIINGGKPMFALATADLKYKLIPDILKQAITPRTKWLLMNSPSNPTGAIYTREALRGLCGVLLRHPHVWLMTDDIDSRLNFTGTPTCHPLQVEPSLVDRNLVVNGASKAYAMSTLQSQSTTGACRISQAAALEALTDPQDKVEEFAQIFGERRDLAVSLLTTTLGRKVLPPGGAFYIFTDCTT